MFTSYICLLAKSYIEDEVKAEWSQTLKLDTHGIRFGRLRA